MQNNSSTIGQLDTSIQKIESMGVPQNLKSDFKDLLDIRSRLSTLDASNNIDRELIEILTGKSAIIIENLISEIMANFEESSNSIIAELKKKGRKSRNMTIEPRFSSIVQSANGESAGGGESVSPSRSNYYSSGGESSTGGEC